MKTEELLKEIHKLVTMGAPISGWFWNYDSSDCVKGYLNCITIGLQLPYKCNGSCYYANFSTEKPVIPRYNESIKDVIDWVKANPRRVVKYGNKITLAEEIDLQIGNVNYFRPKPNEIEVLTETQDVGNPYWVKLSLMKKGE